MYASPKAEKILSQSEELMNLDPLPTSEENGENDNEIVVDDLLDGLI